MLRSMGCGIKNRNDTVQREFKKVEQTWYIHLLDQDVDDLIKKELDVKWKQTCIDKTFFIKLCAP